MKRMVKSVILAIVFALAFSTVGQTSASAFSEKKFDQNKFISSNQEIIQNSDINPQLGSMDQESIEYLESIKVNIIQDDENVRVVETTENNQTIVTALDKTTNIISSQVKGDESSAVEVDLNEISQLEKASKVTTTNGGISTLAASTLKENTFTNYEYTITFSNPEKWQLRRPNPSNVLKYYYKNVSKTTSNSSKLQNFKSAVDSLNYYELMFVGSGTGVAVVTVASFIVASLSGGAGFAGMLVAAGITGAAYNYAMKMNQASNNAHYYYFQV